MRDEIAERAKVQELLRAAQMGADRLGGSARIDVVGVVAAFAETTPPEIADDDFPRIDERAGLVIIGGPDLTLGVSRKPGNLILNWRRLAEVAPDVAIAAAALSGPPWLGFAVALYIWNRIWRGAEEPLSETEASVMYALWKNRGAGNRIDEDTGLARVNAVRGGFGLEALTRPAYARAIDTLLRIECIAMRDGVIELRESVRISYS
jgi:hypothetical protein